MARSVSRNRGPCCSVSSLDRRAQVRFGPVVLTKREIGAADRLTNLGLDLGLAVEPAAELRAGAVE